MYIRMVWGKLRPGAWGEYERHYHERVAGAGNVKGLKERQLLRSTEDPDEGISLVFGIPWKTCAATRPESFARPWPEKWSTSIGASTG